MNLTRDQIFMILFIILASLCVYVWMQRVNEKFTVIPDFQTSAAEFWRVNNYKHWAPWHVHDRNVQHYPVPSIHL